MGGCQFAGVLLYYCYYCYCGETIMGVANLQGSCFQTVIIVIVERLLFASLQGSGFQTVTMERRLWRCQFGGFLLSDCYYGETA